MATQYTQLMKSVNRLKSDMQELVELIEQYPELEPKFEHHYPFTEDFYEVIARVSEWNTYLNDNHCHLCCNHHEDCTCWWCPECKATNTTDLTKCGWCQTYKPNQYLTDADLLNLNTNLIWSEEDTGGGCMVTIAYTADTTYVVTHDADESNAPEYLLLGIYTREMWAKCEEGVYREFPTTTELIKFLAQMGHGK